MRRKFVSQLGLAGVAAIATLAAPAGAQCGYWIPLGPSTGLSGNVHALTIHDFDGAGPMQPSLISVGAFLGAGGVAYFNKVASWDGMKWSELGAGLEGLYSADAVISHDPDGPGPLNPILVAGGQRLLSSPHSTFMWDGAGWVGMPSASFFVAAFASFDPDGPGPVAPELIVGGNTLSEGALSRWNGAAWIPLAQVDERVWDFVVFDVDGSGPGLPRLIMCGDFEMVDGRPIKYFAQWDGAAWSPLPGDIGRWYPTVLGSWDPDGPGPLDPVLLAGTLEGVSRWNGSEWIPMPGSFTPHGLWSYDPDGAGPATPILVATSSSHKRVSRWDGSQWINLTPPQTEGRVSALGEYDGELIVAGDFLALTESVAAERIARWNGTRFARLGPAESVAPDDFVRDFIEFDADGAGPGSSVLVAGGNFIGFQGRPFRRLAQWDGAAWSGMAGGITGVAKEARTFAVFDLDGNGPNPPRLIAGGRFTTIGGVTASNVASWDGASWFPVGANIPNLVDKLFVFDPDGPGGAAAPTLYAGGGYIGLWRWNGQDWDRLASVGFFDSMVAFDLDGPGPLPVELITLDGTRLVSKWDGTQFTRVGGLFHGGVFGLAVFDDDGSGPRPAQLYAGGRFDTIDGEAVSYVVRWDGTRWVSLPSNLDGNVGGLEVYDPDGPGPRPELLVVFGSFHNAGDVASEGIAFWTGTRWCSLEGGVGDSDPPIAVEAFDPDGAGPAPRELFVGGTFDYAGGMRSTHIARWVGGAAPYVTSQPADRAITAGAAAHFAIAATAISGSLSYQWLKDGEPLADGGRVTGSTTAHLSIADIGESDEGSYECEITDACATNASLPARLSLVICPVDFTGDGVVDFSDYLEFLNLFDAQDPRVDFNHDGVIDFSDYLEFLNLYDGGCA